MQISLAAVVAVGLPRLLCGVQRVECRLVRDTRLRIAAELENIAGIIYRIGRRRERVDDIPVRGINVAASGACVDRVTFVGIGRCDRLMHDAVIVVERGAGNSDLVRCVGVFRTVERDARRIGHDAVVRAVFFRNDSHVDCRVNSLRVAALGAGERCCRAGVIVCPVPDGRAVGVVVEQRVRIERHRGTDAEAGVADKTRVLVDDRAVTINVTCFSGMAAGRAQPPIRCRNTIYTLTFRVI